MTEPNTPTAAAHAWASGLDVVFQSSYPQFWPYWDAVQRGLVPVSVIDAAVTRVLRAKFELGLFEQPYVNANAAAAAAGRADQRALALESAHALARVADLAPTKPKDHLMVVNLSGRGDKDLETVARHLEKRAG